MESAGPSPELYRDESETAARFLIRSNQFALSHQRVRPQAFYPSKRDHRVSVFIIDGLEDPQIWYLGEEHVAKPQGRTVLARGELTGNQVSEVGDLRLNRDDHPPRHANIDGWPADKDEWKLLWPKSWPVWHGCTSGLTDRFPDALGDNELRRRINSQRR